MIPSEKNTKKEPLSMWSAYLDKGIHGIKII